MRHPRRLGSYAFLYSPTSCIGLASDIRFWIINPAASRPRDAFVCRTGVPDQSSGYSRRARRSLRAEIAAVDAVPDGAVLCFATGGVRDAAAWGELLATRARAKGAVGPLSMGLREISRGW